ncbi:MAG: tetratricopeptide repeat protein [Acidobacteriota bacterium]
MTEAGKLPPRDRPTPLDSASDRPQRGSSSGRRWVAALLLILAAAVATWAVVGLRRPAGGQPGAGGLGKDLPRGDRSILLITVDTTRADRLEPYGATDIETPVMARLASEGVVFERAYAVAPITLVAHTSILTGLYPPQHGVRNNGTHYVPAELDTLAEKLDRRGYRTAAFVSASVLEKRYGLTQGFEVYDDDLSTGRERHPRMVPDRPAEATVASTRAWLDGVGDDEPFFAWVHFYDPHAAYSPPPPWRDTYRNRPYDGEIAYMDAQIGELLTHPRLRQDDDLAVVVLGDHGESLGEHGEQTHAILAYDATLHVPFVMQVRGGPKGVRVAEPVSQVDLVPTLLDLVGETPPGDLPGRSLLAPRNPRAAAPRPLYSETYLPYYTYGWSKLKVLRRGAWKFIDAPEPELYDLGRDPRELTNQHGQRPSLAHDFARDLGDLLDAFGDAERETALELDLEAVAKLRSLGYVSVGSTGAEDRERIDPKDAIGLHVGLERARVLLRDRLHRQAAEQLRGVLRRDPENQAALVDLASALEMGGEVEEALAILERALTAAPDDPSLILQVAGLESRRGQLAQAVELTNLALELEPRLLEARLQKAAFLAQQRRFDEVRGVLDVALESHPDHPRLGALYAQWVDLREGDRDGAEARLRRALERDPFLVLAWRLLGEMEEDRRAPEAAAKAYRSGLERQPDDPLLHRRLGLLLARTGGDTAAEMHLREAIRLSPQLHPELHVALGGWLAEHGRSAEAQREYDRVLEQDPKHPGARNNRAIALYRSGQVEDAMAELAALVQEFPRHADGHNNLSAIAVERGDWRRAERHARRALELDPKQTEGWNNLGVAVEEQGRTAEAERAYRRALDIDDGYWQARFNLGVVMARDGRHQGAAEALEAVVSRVPGFPDGHLELGRLYAGPLGDPQLARSHWNAFLRTAPPQHPEVAEVKAQLAMLPRRAGGAAEP